MNRKILITGGILGALSILLGAFGAHGLKQLISVEAILTFETGVRYQMYHALFLLFVGSTPMLSSKAKKRLLYLTVTGVMFFSGSIYALATNTLTSFNFKSIGFITPIGGLLLILAWCLIVNDFFKHKLN